MATLTKSPIPESKYLKNYHNHLIELRDVAKAEENNFYPSEEAREAAIELKFREILRRYDREIDEEVERAITPVEESSARKLLRRLFSTQAVLK